VLASRASITRVAAPRGRLVAMRDWRARHGAAGRAIIDVNVRYFNVVTECARPHKNDFFIDTGCFFGGA
jgi:hypothetical protein